MSVRVVTLCLACVDADVSPPADPAADLVIVAVPRDDPDGPKTVDCEGCGREIRIGSWTLP